MNNAEKKRNIPEKVLVTNGNL